MLVLLVSLGLGMSPAASLYRDAVSAHKSGRTVDALSLYRQGIAADPKHVNSHFGLGNALVKLGREQEAVQHLRACAQLAPKQGEARMAHGVVLASTERWSEAAQELREALRLPTLHTQRRPMVAQQLSSAAAALRQEGRYREAVSAFRAAWRHADVAGRRPATALAHAAALSALGRFTDALAIVRTGCKVGSSSAGDGTHEHEFECFEAEGRLLTLLGRQTEARAAFGGALRLRPALRNSYGVGASRTLALPNTLAALPVNSSWLSLPTQGSAHLGLDAAVGDTFAPAVRRLADKGLGVFEIKGLLLKTECAALETLFNRSWVADANITATTRMSQQSVVPEQPLVICVDAAALHDGSGGQSSTASSGVDLEAIMQRAGARPVFERGTQRLCANASEALRQSLRWSQSTLARKGENQALDRLEHRLEALLGLPASHAHPSQLLRYSAESGARGGYAAHTDCAPDLSADDRALTALVYVTEPSGGATTFPRLNISVSPSCGRALIFYSLDKHGFCDMLSEHVAEPVASSSSVPKLVVQKWYNTRSQGRDNGATLFDVSNTGKDTTASMTARGQPYVLCDQSRSCRSYSPFRAHPVQGLLAKGNESGEQDRSEL